MNQPRGTKTYCDHHRESTVNHHKPNKNYHKINFSATKHSQIPKFQTKRIKKKKNPDLAFASASTCGLHPWLHEQVLELVSLGKDPNPVQTHYPRSISAAQTHHPRPISAMQAQATESTTTPRSASPNHHAEISKPKPPRPSHRINH